MDSSVIDAIAKWPNVPACTGWLLLDRRGQWRMRDEACQAAGHSGDPIRHAALNAFIARNYEHDALGRWFFQNGPQRVFVDLAYTPRVVRLHTAPTLSLIDQCGQPLLPARCWTDDQGNVLFSNADGEVALLHDHDLAIFADVALFDDGSESAAHDAQTAEAAARSTEAAARSPQAASDAQAAGSMVMARSARSSMPVTEIVGTLPWSDNRPLPIHSIALADVPEHFGFVQRPRIA